VLADLVAVGDVMLDLEIERLVPGQRVHAPIRMRPGGSAANAALWARSEGASAAVVGRIGNDAQGSLIQGALAERGVIARLAVDPEAPTGTVMIVDLGSSPTVVADRGANANFAAADVPDPLVGGAVLVSGYALLHGDSEAAARAALSKAQASWLAVDAASAPLLERYGAEAFLTAAEAATVLLANEEEGRVLTGRDGRGAVEALAGGFRLVCVKLGLRGAVASLDGEIREAGPATVEPGDRLGAGDAFAAGLLVSLLRGASLAEALAAGCELGARSIHREPAP
jgi:sugar/nucleoside kinase (ribokinase family)